PHKPLTSSNNWASGGQYYTSSSMRSVVREEFDGRVCKNDESVFRRLGIDQVSNAFSKAYCEAHQSSNQEALQELNKIASAAVSRRVRSRLAKADDPTASLDEQAKGLGWEVNMYPHLQRLCNSIVNFQSELDASAARHITIAPNREFKGAEHTTGFPKVNPDGTGSSVVACDSWLSVDWFLDVKPRVDQGVATKETTIPEAVCQGADYSRLHMSSRPFQLFSVGLLIFGLKFMVGIFDRDGITFSPVYDLNANLETFVKVIRRLVSPRLTAIDLGLDPTVFQLPSAHPLHTALRPTATSLGVSANFPAFIVRCPKELNRMDNGGVHKQWTLVPWVTIGPPIWVSLSLIGRETNIWRVAPVQWVSGAWTFVSDGTLSILKNSWRNSQRTGEAVIYGSLRIHPPGVARCTQGGDVVFPDARAVISGYNLRTLPAIQEALYMEEYRQPESPSGDGQPTSVLHRLILQTIGRPLWDFVSYMELLQAFRAAVAGELCHQQLVDQGILHRDISAGNIMISAGTPNPGERGFLMDLEFAKIAELVHVVSGEGGPTRTTWTTPKRGVQMTGTVQFMAREILDSVKNQKPIEHQEHHDLESFAWVFAYVVLRRLLRDAKSKDQNLSNDAQVAINAKFEQSFGGLNLSAVILQRDSLGAFELDPGYIPEPLKEFVIALGYQVRANYHRTTVADVYAAHIPLPPVRKMTHLSLLSLIDATINEMARKEQIGFMISL
ncbi:hypothetical protein BXZ70DRAFT_902862, partial [Cristinia sonorae]